jgi:phosphoribosyl 1,2-cyclic phosphodiesterase
LGELCEQGKEGYHNILIDAGKTFRDAYFTTMAPLGVQTLTALLLTHDHADAIGGLDDIRDLQAFRCVGETFKCLYFTPCFLSSTTMKTLDKQLSYVTANSIRTGNHAARKTRSEEALAADKEQREKFLNRRVACMDFIELSDVEVEPVDVPGLEGVPFYSIPLFHGGKYRSLGYAFGRGVEPSATALEGQNGPCVAYLSDISEFPTDSIAFLKRRKIDVLVLDCLLGPFQTHFSHFCLDQFWDATVELQPVTAYGVGMFCELEHELTNQMLEARLKDYKAKFPESRIQSVQLAYDGLTLKMDL